MGAPRVGIIGGSGLYKLLALQNAEEKDIITPFGKPSAPFIIGKMNGVNVVFLARHGNGHALLPSEIPYRENIWGMKFLGVEYILASTAVGSMDPAIPPGHIVIPDQQIDFTKHRQSTFFGDGVVAHMGFKYPFCNPLGDALFHVASEWYGSTVHRGGTYICIEGSHFSTEAESLLYKNIFGVTVIGMTTATEAKLAREAEIHYSPLALGTDFCSWHPEEEAVTAAQVSKVVMENAEMAQRILYETLPLIKQGGLGKCGCARALNGAIMSNLTFAPEKTLEKLEPILKRYRQRARG